MQGFLDFFEFMPVWVKLVWIVGCITLFWVLEGNYGQFQLKYKKWKHARINFSLLGMVILINTLFGVLAAGVFIWVAMKLILGCCICSMLPFG